jgi:hypothetical protein
MQKFIRIFLFVLIIIGIVLLATQNSWVPNLVAKILSSENSLPIISTKQSTKTPPSILITDQKIKEENFTGTMPVISGTNTLAIKMREFIKTTVDEFRKQANTDVPDMRAKFGANSPPATYEIDINAKYIKGIKTESIVTDVYTYTGGAHGSTIYKVLTANIASGKVLTLADIIKKEKQNAFTEFVKTELNSWIPAGNDTSPVFPDEVKSLTFNSFANWSMDNVNLTIYFDQYAIGPGVLGATAFPLPLPKITDFLN